MTEAANVAVFPGPAMILFWFLWAADARGAAEPPVLPRAAESVPLRQVFALARYKKQKYKRLRTISSVFAVVNT